jgi:AraC-like DNA-binding protein
MPIYKSADDYLFFLRMLRGMRLLREHPEYGIVSVSEMAGFNSVRTFQRRMLDAIGITPVEFRMLVEKDR